MRNVENRWEERRAPKRPERRALLGVRLGFPSWEPAVTVRAVSRAMGVVGAGLSCILSGEQWGKQQNSWLGS